MEAPKISRLFSNCDLRPGTHKNYMPFTVFCILCAHLVCRTYGLAVLQLLNLWKWNEVFLVTYANPTVNADEYEDAREQLSAQLRDQGITIIDEFRAQFDQQPDSRYQAADFATLLTSSYLRARSMQKGAVNVLI